MGETAEQEYQQRYREVITNGARRHVHDYVLLLKAHAKELLQRIRSVELRNPEEYRVNCAERARLVGILDACIDFLADEEREDSDGR